LTGNQVRDKLTDIALKVLEDNKRLGSGPKSQAFGEFRSRLSPDPKGNGGNEGTEGFKHNSKLGCPERRPTADQRSQDWTTEWDPCHCQSPLSEKRPPLTFSPPSFSMVSRRTLSAHLGARRNGRSSSRESTSSSPGVTLTF
jgi:hypothetical protein